MTTKPNILLILVDDMGYSDIGCYGAEIRTPHLDNLAANGVRFSSAYNCARCCPSRAALLTGLYPHQTGVGAMTRNDGLPGYRGFLTNNCVTIAEALKGTGYATWMSGKWHVGGDYVPAKPETWVISDDRHPHPMDRGFDEFYGMLTGAGSFFRPPTLARGRMFIEPEGDDYYFTDAIADEACRMMRGATQQEKPFFGYVAFTAPHWPLHARPRDIERYRGQYTDGWGPLRTSRHEALKGLGILSDQWPISPADPEAPDWGLLSRKRREWEAHKMAVYAAQVDAFDQGIGRMVATLEELGQLDNTLIIFASDNGGCAEFLREDGHAANYSIAGPDGRMPRVGNRPDIEPGPADTFMSYELPWANASNAPFRYYKAWVHEGGIATPLVCHWPKGMPGVRNAIRHDLVHFIDVMPTILDAAGARYPSEHNGQPITPVEGESFLNALRGQGWQRERPLYWEHEGNRAIRHGDLKLVSQKEGLWELHNMADDRTEVDDYFPRYRTESKALEAQWQDWARRIGVVSINELRERRQAQRVAKSS